MTMTRKAWWSRARWFLLLYSLVGLMGITASPFDGAIRGWKWAIVIFSLAAIAGLLGSLRVVIGLKKGHRVFALLEFSGVCGLVVFETLHASYVLALSFLGGPWSLGRGVAHATIALALAIAYRSRPVRDRRIA